MMDKGMSYRLDNPPILKARRIYLRVLRPSDVNAAYCRWMNDPLVIQYLESRFQKADKTSIRNFVRSVNLDSVSCLFGIRINETHQHIGNVKLGPLDIHHRRSEIGILIGETSFWGKGYASEAISLIVKFALEDLGLHKLTAGCYAPNEGSVGLFKKCGFSVDGIRKAHCFYDGDFVDAIQFGLIRTDAPSR